MVGSMDGEREDERLSQSLEWNSPLTGHKIDDMWDLDPSGIKAVDIVHGLRQNRFTFHTYPPINLLSHSVAVSEYLEEVGEDEYVQLVGLLHDAHEAYTGDTVRPVKILYPEIDELEMYIQDAVWASFGIEPPAEDTWAGSVDEADQAVLLLEADETASNEERLDSIRTYLEDHEVTEEKVMEMSEDIRVSRGRQEAMRDFRTRLEYLMDDVYGRDHLESNYDESLMDEYGIPGGIDGGLRRSIADNVLVGVERIHRWTEDARYRSGRQRRDG